MWHNISPHVKVIETDSQTDCPLLVKNDSSLKEQRCALDYLMYFVKTFFQDADLALGKFRMTSSRDSVIDFTEPFMYETAGMAMKRPTTSGVC